MKRVRVVVTGQHGQVVRSLVERASGTNIEVVPLGRPELDLAGDPERIRSSLEHTEPDIIVSAAAYTQVDRAEKEPEIAFAINRDGPRAIGIAARALNVPIIHLSTDYVFDGLKNSPYCEQDRTGPTGVYGSSKLAGEVAVWDASENGAILRTAWVYSPFGSNFVKTMLRLASERDELSVVADQCGNPTSALDIADGILKVASNLAGNDDPKLRGIFHMTAAGEASWADFAEAIFEQSAQLGGPSAIVKRIATADYPTAAQRPINSRLDSTQLERVHGVSLPVWRTSLKDVISRLLEQDA